MRGFFAHRGPTGKRNLPALAAAAAAQALWLAPPAAADITVGNGRSAEIDVQAFAVADDAGPGQSLRDNPESTPNFTSFSAAVPPLSASDTGSNGNATARASGSGGADFTVADGVLTINVEASFNSRGTFEGREGQNIRGGGSAAGDIRASFPITVTDRPAEFFISGRHTFDLNATAGRGGSVRARAEVTGAGNELLFFTSNQSSNGSGVRAFSSSGVVNPTGYSAVVNLDVDASAGPALQGAATAAGSISFTLVMRPAGKWENPAGGSFHVGSNWVGDIVPAPNEAAVFDVPGTYTVTFDRDTTTHSLRVGGAGANVTYDLDGHRYTLHEMNLGTGAGDNVNVTVRGGDSGPAASAAGAGRVAVAGPTPGGGQVRVGSTGRVGAGARYSVVDGVAVVLPSLVGEGGVSVRDLGTRLEVADLTVGDAFGGDLARSPTLEVENAATLLTNRAAIGARSTGIGHVFVDGAESLWQVAPNGELDVGLDGKGFLEVLQGGAVLARQGTLSVGVSGGAEGEVRVADEGSLLEAREAVIAAFGKGTLDVIRGGAADFNVLGVGVFEGATGTVRVGGLGAELTADTLLICGPDSVNSTGTLEVTQGGDVTGFETLVGRGGRIRVDAALSGPEDTTFGSQNLVVESGGKLDLVNRAFGIASQNATVGGGGGGASAASVDNSRFRVGDNLTIAAAGTVTALNNGHLSVGDLLLVDAGGFLRVEEDGMVNIGEGNPVVGAIRVGPNGTLSGSGGVLTPHLVDAGGVIAPGNSPGTLTVDGDYTQQSAGLLHIELAGTAPGLFDVLVVTGDAALGGSLRLEFIDRFAPRAGDRFEFLDVGGTLAGDFSRVEVRNLAPGFQFDLTRDAGGIALVARSDGVFVPEPASAAILALPALLLARRRRQVE